MWPFHRHRWKVYDVYWLNPHLGNKRCDCGARRKGLRLTDEEVAVYLREQNEED